ncbi:hypothetical protein ACWCXB_02960 [Streptomyces sp. NPDC001514]
MEMIGFFREMNPENPTLFRESIRDRIPARTPYPKAEIAAYLSSGHPVFDITEVTVDVIEGSFRVPGGSSLLTDGKYVWRVDLAMYVERYLVDLPGEFLSFAVEHGFTVPPVPTERLMEVSIAAGKTLGFHMDAGAEPRRDA